MAKLTPQEIKAKIAARKAERKAEKVQKYRKMRLVAAKAPEKLEKHLIGLADKFADAAEGIENLRENLGLVRAAKSAPLKVRLAAGKVYGLKFKKVAEEAPEKLEDALREAYNGLNAIAQDIEFAAEQMGVSLEESAGMEGTEMESEPVEIAEDEHEVIEEAEEAGLPVPPEVSEHAEEEGEEKEAAGSDWFVSDRDESGAPKNPEQIEVPRVAAGSGSEAWVNDRDESGIPEAPAKAEIPQAQGQAQTPGNKGAARKRAESLQEVSGGTPSAPDAASFVEDIPQSQGKSEAPGNKSAKKATPAGKSAAGSL